MFCPDFLCRIHFAKLCGDCTNSNHSRAKLKQVVSVEVIWQGEPIQCTKSARTRACKICMVERKQIMKALRDDKHKVINENDDIYAACKCSTRFHKFAHIDSDALRTRLTQKKVTPKRKSKKACGNRKPAPPGQENRQQTTPEWASIHFRRRAIRLEFIQEKDGPVSLPTNQRGGVAAISNRGYL